MRQTRITASLALLVIPPFLTFTAAQSYGIVESHHGTSFFDGWEFETGYDNTTSGDVFWQSNSSVAYTQSSTTSSTDTVILAVDNTTFPGTSLPYLDKRNSVELLSRNWYNFGTVFVLDAAHIPTGCSVWPAWWTQGNDWPLQGEIDIVEAVNQATTNQYAIHTNGSCTPSTNSTLGQSGTAGSTECSVAVAGTGCTVTQPSTAGSAINSAGGGVWIMSFESTTIAMWFFSRADVPSSITQGASSIDVTTLGTAAASFATGGSCDLAGSFGAQQMTLDITLCGDYAGVESVLSATCNAPATGQTYYSTYVTDASNYAEAYWAINYVNVFGTSNSINTTYSPAGSSSSSPSSTNAAGSSSTGASKSTITSAGATTVVGTGSSIPVATTGVSGALMTRSTSALMTMTAIGALCLVLALA